MAENGGDLEACIKTNFVVSPPFNIVKGYNTWRSSDFFTGVLINQFIVHKRIKLCKLYRERSFQVLHYLKRAENLPEHAAAA